MRPARIGKQRFEDEISKQEDVDFGRCLISPRLAINNARMATERFRCYLEISLKNRRGISTYENVGCRCGRRAAWQKKDEKEQAGRNLLAAWSLMWKQVHFHPLVDCTAKTVSKITAVGFGPSKRDRLHKIKRLVRDR